MSHAQKSFELRPLHRRFRFEGDPVRPRKIWSRDDARAFDQLGEFFGVGLEGEPDARRLQANYGEHFSANFENQVIFPLDLFRGVGKSEAESTKPFNVHLGRIQERMRCW